VALNSQARVIMPKLTQKSLEENWYRIHKNRILNLLSKHYGPKYKEHYTDLLDPKPTLAELVVSLADIPKNSVPHDDIEPGHYEPFFRFVQLLPLLNTKKKPYSEILDIVKSAQPSAQANVRESGGDSLFDDDEEQDDLGLQQGLIPARPAPQEPIKNYYKAFELAARKREAAKESRLRWFLNYQKEQMEKLLDMAWWGKIRAIMYGMAVGVAMAGFMLMFLHGAVSTAAMAVMGFTLVPFLAYFPVKANFWITRRDPTELSFDLFSPHEPETRRPVNDGWSDRTYKFLNTPVFGYTVKELLARLGGLLNATVYGGLTATGMWELFTEFGLNSLYSSYGFTIGSLAIPYAAIPCAIITLVMSNMVFKPELGLGVKFIRRWLNKNPIQSFIDMNDTVNPDHSLTNKYFLRFAALFSCIVIGGVFTTLAAADLVGTLTGGTGWIIKLSLSFLTISVVPFYYEKAIDNVRKEHTKDEVKAGRAQQDPSLKKEPAFLSHPWFVRRFNALVHAVPAFLGGLATFTGVGGIFFGLFTGLAGFGASYISGENGAEEGFEKEIGDEIEEIGLTLQDPSLDGWIDEVPLVEVEGQGRQLATKQPYLLNFYNMSSDTEESAMDLLKGRVPVLSSEKQKMS
jgi:hypothetical protein